MLLPPRQGIIGSGYERMLAKDAAFNAETADFTGHEEEFRMAGYADTQHLHNRCATSQLLLWRGVSSPCCRGPFPPPLSGSFRFRPACCSNPLHLFMLHAFFMHACMQARTIAVACPGTHAL